MVIVVAGRELVDPVERRAVRGAVAGDGGVADLAGHRRVGVVAGALAEVGHAHALRRWRDRAPIFGMWISPMPSPVGGATGGTVVVVVPATALLAALGLGDLLAGARSVRRDCSRAS